MPEMSQDRTFQTAADSSLCQQGINVGKTEEFYKLVVNFFSRMSSEQWTLLRSGTPDTETRIMMADILLSFIYSVSDVLLRTYQSTHTSITEECVCASVGDKITESFARAIDLQVEVGTASAENLKNLVIKEVTERVNADLYPQVGDFDTAARGPGRLNEMVHQALKMMKEFCAKACCNSWSRKGEQRELLDRDPMEDQGSYEEKITDTPGGSSLSSCMAVEFQNIIEEEILKINNTQLEYLDEQSQKLILQSHTQEIKSIANDMADAVTKSLTAGLEPVGEDLEIPANIVKDNNCSTFFGRIKGLFDKLFAKATLHRTLDRLQSEMHDEANRVGHSSLSYDVGVQQLTVGATSQMQGMRSDPCGRSVSELSNIIYMNTGAAAKGEDGGWAPSGSMNVPESDVPVYNKIKNGVRHYNDLVDWWSTTQSENHSEKVTLNLIESVIKKEKDPKQSCKAQVLKQKMFLRLLIEKLVTLTYKKAQINWPMTNPAASIERILKVTWSAVVDIPATINPAMLEKLPKIIFKELCNKWGPALDVLASLNAESPEIEDYIASSIRDHLLRPKGGGTLSYFLKFFSKPFKQKVEVSS